MKILVLVAGGILIFFGGGLMASILNVMPIVMVHENNVENQSPYGKLPPEFLIINGERWYAEATSMKLDPYGLTECDRRMIWYDPNQTSVQLRDTMWHEIFHAELCHADKSIKNSKANWASAVDNNEHLIVYPLGAATASFVHDNPQFVEWAEVWR